MGPKAPELHGQMTVRETRSRTYAAVWGHDLWMYPNKESFQLGIASFSVPLNVATVKLTGKHSFALITPYKTFKYTLVEADTRLSVCANYPSVAVSACPNQLYPPSPHFL